MRFRTITLVLATLAASILAYSSFAAEEGVVVKAQPTRRVFNVDEQNARTRLEPNYVGPYGDGYVEKDGVFRCETPELGQNGKGVRFTFSLNQKTPTPIVAEGWSKAENVDGDKSADYSLYIDLIYEDDSPLWGQTYAFPTGNSDWTKGKIVIFPDKPIKFVTFYGMFRGKTGAVEFKDFALYEYKIDERVLYFDRQPVEVGETPVATAPSYLFFDQALDAGQTFLGVDAQKLNSGATADFDGVRLNATSTKFYYDVEETRIRLYTESDRDRVFTFYYALPVPQDPDASVIRWYDGPRAVRKADVGDFRFTRKIADVGAGETSPYPIGVVDQPAADGRSAAYRALAIDPEYPAFYRVFYNAATRELCLAFDLALTKEKPSIELRFVQIVTTIETEPSGGEPRLLAFRDAFARYQATHPHAFRVRAVKQGNWMAFAKISKVKDWEDFGFQFKEGIDELDEDDSRNVTSFRYTEPMTWWQQITKSETSPKSKAAAIENAREFALGNKKNADGSPSWNTREAQALFTTGFRDVNGDFFGMLLDTPWCDGVVWSMNDAPGLVRLAREGKLKNDANAPMTEAGIPLVAGFATKWSDEIANNLYGKSLDPTDVPTTRDDFVKAATMKGCDGEYVDSSEGYVTATLDFHRPHFAGMATPLTFDAETRKPAIFRGLIAFEYVRQISRDVHARGKLIMANATPSLHFWLAPQLDVLGTETNWNWGDAWRPMPDDELLFRRFLCGGKPYCFLMNTDFSKFTKEMTELYMKRAVAYGMFPSFFSQDASTGHYFETPELYERDRPLFKKYMPIVIAVAEQGWEPITFAYSNDPKIYVERFGALPGQGNDSNQLRPTNTVYLTVFNDTDSAKPIKIYFDKALRDFASQCEIVDVEREDVKLQCVSNDDGNVLNDDKELDAQDVRVYRFTPKNSIANLSTDK